MKALLMPAVKEHQRLAGSMAELGRIGLLQSSTPAAGS